MTVGVDDELRIREYPGDDSATARPVPFYFLDNDDLKVTRTNADGSETVLVRGTDYTVSGAGNPSGGSVTPLAAIATGTIWRIEGDMALGQLTDYTAGDDFPAESHERGLDRAMIGLQEARRDLSDVSNRAPLVERGSVAPALDLSGLLDGDILTYRDGKLKRLAREPFAGMFYAGDANGKPIPASGTGADGALRGDLADAAAGAKLLALAQGGSADDAIKWMSPDMVGAAANDLTDDHGALAVWAAAVGQAKAGRLSGTYKSSEGQTFTGEYATGLFVDGAGARVTITDATENGFTVNNLVGDVAGEYFNKARLDNLYYYGGGKAGGAAGLLVEMAADVVATNLRARNFQYGLRLAGGLSSAFYNPVLRDNAIGLKASASAGPPLAAAPNANSFFRAHIMKNDVAIEYDTSANSAISFFGGNIEGNNQGGTTVDGKVVSTFANAGNVSFFGLHDESNLGQTGLKYTGSAAAKNLLIAGSEMISGHGRLVHIETGRFTSIANRISNGAATDDTWFNAANASGVLINHEGRISGTLSKVAALREGRVGFGRNPTSADPLITATPEAIAAVSNVVANWQNDTIQLRFQNSAGTRVAYIQTVASGDHTINNDNATGGWAIRANNSSRLYVGRAGAMSVEPGSDNNITGGSAVYRFSVLWAGTGTISTSDERDKTWRGAPTEAELRAAKRVIGELGFFRWKDAIAEKGADGARYHFGVRAQRVWAIMADEGLIEPIGADGRPGETGYAFLCWDEWEDQVEVEPTYSTSMVDEAGIPLMISETRTVVRKAGERFGIRYEQLLLFLMAAQEARLAAIEALHASGSA